jgi:hypothetical protein
MDIREVVSEFKNVAPLAGLADAWHWSPAPGINFAGALSADGARLLQLSTKPGFAEELARRTLEFAREHEQEMAARNPYMGTVEGFSAPDGFTFDAVVVLAPEVHGFYKVERPELMPHVRLAFPAYAQEFAGDETVEESVTRYKAFRLNNVRRGPLPYLRMRYANTRGGMSTNPGRGFTDPATLERELRRMEGAGGSFVEFENRHHQVWHVVWQDGYRLSDGESPDPAAREFALDDLLAFAAAELAR